MADIRYIVTVDSKGATKSIEKWNETLKDSKDHAEKSEKAHSGLWKQIAAGIAVVAVAQKAIRALTGFVKDSISAAAQQELAEKNLADALFVTGRSVDELMPKFREFAKEVQKQTTYGDEAALSAMSLMAQLTDLDRIGLEAATKGAIGLASVFKTDLQSAATLVAKGLAGNVGALSRYGIQVDKNLTAEEKRVEILRQLGLMYERAKGETDTFSGSLVQLKNLWGDLKEKVGSAITENEKIRELFDKIKKGIIDLVESGKLDAWVSSLSQSISSLIKIFEGLYTAIDAVISLANKIPSIHSAARKFYQEQMSYVDKLAAEGKARAEAFQESLKILNIPLERLREEMEKGEKNWLAYTTQMKALDDAMVANQGKATDWINKIKEFLGIADEVPKKIQDETDALADETKKLKEKITVLETAKLAHRNLLNIVEQAPSALEDEAYAYATLLPPARDFNNIVSLAPGYMNDMAYAVETATKDSSDYFAGLYNNIAQGFGDTIARWLEGATTFKDFMIGLWKDIYHGFTQWIGEKVTKELISFFDSIGKKSKEIAGAATAGVQEVAGAVGGAAGGAAQGLLGAVTAVSTAVTAVASIASLFMPAKKQTDVTYWLKFITDNTQVAENLLFEVDRKLDDIRGQAGQAVGWLAGIYDSLAGSVSAQGGFSGITTRPTLFRTHAYELVNIQPQIKVTPGAAYFNLAGRQMATAMVPYLAELSKAGVLRIHTNAIREY